MKVVVQRVSQASVLINNDENRSIGQGYMILLGITHDDEIADIQWLTRKILGLRIFSDENGKMNKSLLDVQGSILLISQFTLHSSTKKGNRPSFIQAAKPDIAIPLYETIIKELRQSVTVETGTFGADMQVSLINDGPVTIIIDSKNKT